jgi:hypothetical protein
VRVWVILDRPPNDPFLRKKEPFTSSLTPLRIEAGSFSEAGVLSKSNHDEEGMSEMIVNEQTSTTTRRMRRVHLGEEAEI